MGATHYDPQHTGINAVDPVAISDAYMADLKRLVELAESGDAEALPPLRKMLADQPVVFEHVRSLGHAAEDAWIQQIAGPDPCLKVALRERLKHLRQKLIGNDPTIMDELLARQISLTYLQAEFYETVVATLPRDAAAKLRTPIEQRRDAAHKRHLLALKTFAETRKLLAESPTSLGRQPNPKPKTAKRPRPAMD